MNNQAKRNTFNLNMDFTKTVCLRPEDQEWVTSPADGVARVHRERVSEVPGHVTSCVKFEPDSYFPTHTHPNGEEIYVLDGVFSDENGDYPAGTYIRNPPASFHKPFTKEGCKLFVKLEQFKGDDIEHVVIRPEDQQWSQGFGNLKVLSLHMFHTESTALVAWPKNEVFQSHSHMGGEEIIVISGKVIDEHGEYPTDTWLRSPHLSKHFPRVEEKTLIYVKVGHL